MIRRLLLVAAALTALALPASALAQHITFFKTPSGNIHCAFFGPHHGQVRCDIGQTGNAVKPRPSWCDFDFGKSYGVTRRGHGRRLCVSDSVNDPHARTLRYGKGIRKYGITCRSRTTGLRCTNRRHHGFFLSRAAQHVF